MDTTSPPESGSDRYVLVRVWPPVRHGRRGTYNQGCRCWPCTDDNTRKQRIYRGSKPRQVARHGSRAHYRTCTAGPDGGKCERCKNANRRYQAAYMRARRRGEAWAGMSGSGLDQ